MQIYDLTNAAMQESNQVLDTMREYAALFVICRPKDVARLQGIFGFDESTVLDCADLDESVRYACFDGYDFVSLIHLDFLQDSVELREINLYVSHRYMILVMPEHNSARLSALETKLREATKGVSQHHEPVPRMYYLLLHHLLADFSDTLETMEDHMETLSEQITEHVNTSQLHDINRLRRMSYTAKKQLRALSYIGAQIVIDENHLFHDDTSRLFRGIDTRLRKLYDFAANLYDLGGQLTTTYDSKLSMKTNDMVNKLTVLTLFFGPLTVITGIYGMNFDFMPELRFRYGYLIVLLIMALITILLYLILKRKKWL